MKRQRRVATVASRVLEFGSPLEYYAKYETINEPVPVNEKNSILYFFLLALLFRKCELKLASRNVSFMMSQRV